MYRDYNNKEDDDRIIDLAKESLINLDNINGVYIPNYNENSDNYNTLSYETPIYTECSNTSNEKNLYNNSYKMKQHDIQILSYLGSQIEKVNHYEVNNINCILGRNLNHEKDILKKNLNRLEVKQIFVKIFLESKRVKVIGRKILCNLKGYWKDISVMEEMEKHKMLSSIFYIITKEILGKGINLTNINRIIGTYKELWAPIEKMILSEREFLFELGEANKSLKQIVRENPWINFKSYIVNPITLEVIKKESMIIDEIDIEIDNTNYIIENNIMFDCCINTDPEVIKKDDKYILQLENNINADIFDYFCKTSLGNNLDKRKLLLQHIGYSISADKDKKIALYVIGPPNTGKTLIKKLCERYYNESLISDKELALMNSDAARYKLMNVKMNIVDEANGNSISKLNTFKKIVSGSKDNYNKSGIERSDYYNLGLIFLGNEFMNPPTGNETPIGYLDKFSILKTERFDFTSIPFKKEEFKQKFINEENKSKVITLAIYELNRLYENEFEFVETEDSRNEKINHVQKWITKELKKGSREDYIREEMKYFKYSPYENQNEYLDVKNIKEMDNLDIKNSTLEKSIFNENLIKDFIDEKIEFSYRDLSSSIKDLNISMEDLQKNIFNTFDKSERSNGLDLLEEFTKFESSRLSSNNNLDFVLKVIDKVKNEDKSQIKNIKTLLSNFLDLLKSELKKRNIVIIEVNRYKDKESDSEETKNKKLEYEKECRKNTIDNIINNKKVVILKEIRVKNNSGTSSRLGFIGLKIKE